MSNISDNRLLFHTNFSSLESKLITESITDSGPAIDLEFHNSNFIITKLNSMDFEDSKTCLINLIDNQNFYKSSINNLTPNDTTNPTTIKSLYVQLFSDTGIPADDKIVETVPTMTDKQIAEEFIIYISYKYYIITQCLLRILLDTNKNINDGDDKIPDRIYYTGSSINGISQISSTTSSINIISKVFGVEKTYDDLKNLLQNIVSNEIEIFVKIFYGIEDVFQNSIEALAELNNLQTRNNNIISSKYTYSDKVDYTDKIKNYYNIHYYVALILLIFIVVGNLLTALKNSNSFMMVNVVVLIFLFVRKFGQQVLNLIK
jgi:hypothetical protein